MENRVNPSIQCSVTSCAHHCQEKQYCSLPEIKVGCCDSKVTSCTSTECASFALAKDSNGNCGCR